MHIEIRKTRQAVFALLFCLSVFTLSSFTGQQKNREVNGAVLYSKNCKRCHGIDGTHALFGAKNLRISTLSDSDVIRQITKGKGGMPAFRKKLSPAELQFLLGYVKTLRSH